MVSATELSTAEEDKWPAVEAAYDFVVPSYQMLMSRFEAADTRLTTLLTLVSTLTLSAPILAKAVQKDISFKSPFFIVGAVCFIAAVVLGTLGRVKGSIQLPDPMVFHQTGLHESSWTFKKNAVYFAGLAFKANSKAVRLKGTLAFTVLVALLLEIGSFVAWVAFS